MTWAPSGLGHKGYLPKPALLTLTKLHRSPIARMFSKSTLLLLQLAICGVSLSAGSAPQCSELGPTMIPYTGTTTDTRTYYMNYQQFVNTYYSVQTRYGTCQYNIHKDNVWYEEPFPWINDAAERASGELVVSDGTLTGVVMLAEDIVYDSTTGSPYYVTLKESAGLSGGDLTWKFDSNEWLDKSNSKKFYDFLIKLANEYPVAWQTNLEQGLYCGSGSFCHDDLPQYRCSATPGSDNCGVVDFFVTGTNGETRSFGDSWEWFQDCVDSNFGCIRSKNGTKFNYKIDPGFTRWVETGSDYTYYAVDVRNLGPYGDYLWLCPSEADADSFVAFWDAVVDRKLFPTPLPDESDCTPVTTPQTTKAATTITSAPTDSPTVKVTSPPTNAPVKDVVVTSPPTNSPTASPTAGPTSSHVEDEEDDSSVVDVPVPSGKEPMCSDMNHPMVPYSETTSDSSTYYMTYQQHVNTYYSVQTRYGACQYNVHKDNVWYEEPFPWINDAAERASGELVVSDGTLTGVVMLAEDIVYDSTTGSPYYVTLKESAGLSGGDLTWKFDSNEWLDKSNSKKFYDFLVKLANNYPVAWQTNIEEGLFCGSGPFCYDELPGYRCSSVPGTDNCGVVNFYMDSATGRQSYGDVWEWFQDCVDYSFGCTRTKNATAFTYKQDPGLQRWTDVEDGVTVYANSVRNFGNPGDFLFLCPTQEIADQFADFFYEVRDRHLFSTEVPDPDCTRAPTASPTDSPTESPMVDNVQASSTTAEEEVVVCPGEITLVHTSPESGTSMEVSPVSIVRRDHDSVTLDIRSAFASLGSPEFLFVEYMATSHEETCLQVETVETITARCLQAVPFSIVSVYVADASYLTSGVDTANIAQCCHASTDAKALPTVEYTFQIACDPLCDA